jgi:hypothetical protein
MTLEAAKQLLKEHSKNLTYEATCPALTAIDNRVYWEVTHGLSTSNIVVGLFNLSGDEVEKTYTIISPNKIRVSWVCGDVIEGDFSVLVVSGGASSGIIIDEFFSPTSTNPVWNATITGTVYELSKMLEDFNSGMGVS